MYKRSILAFVLSSIVFLSTWSMQNNNFCGNLPYIELETTSSGLNNTTTEEQFLDCIREKNLTMADLLLGFCDLNKSITIPKPYPESLQTTLFLAAIKAGADHILLQELINKGANLFQTDSNYETALMYAMRYNTPIIDFICRHYSNSGISFFLNCSNKEDNNALMIALTTHNKLTDIIRKLIKHGIDINKSNWKGQTPLMLAAIHHPVVMGQLVRAGANIHAVDNKLRTAEGLLYKNYPQQYNLHRMYRESLSASTPHKNIDITFHDKTLIECPMPPINMEEEMREEAYLSDDNKLPSWQEENEEVIDPLSSTPEEVEI